MEKEGRQGEGFERFLNRRIAVFYEDSDNHISRKDGDLISTSSDSIILLSFNDLEMLIPKNKIVRIEFKNDN